MTAQDENSGPVAVLVIHGVGVQQPGETVGKLLKGLRGVIPASDSNSFENGTAGTLKDRQVRFYEVYWADLLQGPVTRGTFILADFQCLAWFPWLNFWRGAYNKGAYSKLTILWWLLVLPVMNFLLYFAYFGARLATQLWEAMPGRSPRAERVRPADRASEYTLIDHLLDEYVGDVVNYINSAGDAFYRTEKERPVSEHIRHVHRPIIDRFYEQLVSAKADGCQSIHIVSHSLGTVIMYHALRGLRLDEVEEADLPTIRNAAALVDHVYTIGSPLEKIQFFWPALKPLENLIGDRRINWDNFVSWFDPVAGRLRRYDDWGSVRNHRLLGGGFIRGHVVYERSPVFLGRLTAGLCGTPLYSNRSRGEKVKDTLFLVGESLVGPAALLVVLLLGAAVLGIVVMILPFLVSLPFRPFFDSVVWGPILDKGSLIMAAVVGVVLFLAPPIRASRAHKLFWKQPKGCRKK